MDVPVSFTVLPRDASGNARLAATAELAVTIEGWTAASEAGGALTGGGDTITPSITASASNPYAYVVSFASTRAATATIGSVMRRVYKITVSLGGSAKPAYFASFYDVLSLLSFSADASSFSAPASVVAGASLTVRAVAMTSAGAELRVPGLTFVGMLMGPAGEAAGFVEFNNATKTYLQTVTAPSLAGTYSLRVFSASGDLSSLATATLAALGPAVSLAVVGGVATRASVAAADATAIAAGDVLRAKVSPVDALGNPSYFDPKSPANFTVRVAGVLVPGAVSAPATATGPYTLAIPGALTRAAGALSVQVQLDGVDVTGSPLSVTVAPQPRPRRSPCCGRLRARPPAPSCTRSCPP